MRQRCHVLELADTNPILNESLRVFDFLIIPLAGAFLQLVPMIMELVAPIESQRLYLIVGASRGNFLRRNKLRLYPNADQDNT